MLCCARADIEALATLPPTATLRSVTLEGDFAGVRQVLQQGMAGNSGRVREVMAQATELALRVRHPLLPDDVAVLPRPHCTLAHPCLIPWRAQIPFEYKRMQHGAAFASEIQQAMPALTTLRIFCGRFNHLSPSFFETLAAGMFRALWSWLECPACRHHHHHPSPHPTPGPLRLKHFWLHLCEDQNRYEGV